MDKPGSSHNRSHNHDETREVFDLSDTNLIVYILILLLLQILSYAMTDKCTC